MSKQEQKESESKEFEGQTYGFFDIDDTLTEGNTTVSFSRFLAQSNFISEEHWLKISEDIKSYQGSDRGEIAYSTFATDILNHLAQSLKGKEVNAVKEKAREFFGLVLEGKINGYKICDFSRQLISEIKKKGVTVAISGSPEEVLAPIIDYLDFDKSETTIFGNRNEHFTGEVIRNLAIDIEKRIAVARYLKQTNVPKSFAFGDSTHDIPLLGAVKNSFVLGNNSILQTIGVKNGWNICINGEGVLDKIK